jgi:TRAP-type C4-dicarboxylate transport system substrate-binding protein
MAEIFRGNFLKPDGKPVSPKDQAEYTQKAYTSLDESILEIDNLWGLFADYETQSEITEAIRGDVARIVGERSGGVVLAFQFYPSNYFFTKKPLRKPADIQGLKVRSHNKALDDLLRAMGATADSTIFDSVYQAFESGQLDAAVSCSSCGARLAWHEVTGCLVGPMVGLSHSWMAISSRVWEQLPQDIQVIIREEAKRHEEATRRDSLAAWDQRGVQENVETGMEHINLTPEIKEMMRTAALSTVLPNWVQRGGGAASDAVTLFNQKIAPIVKVEITEDGEAREIE